MTDRRKFSKVFEERLRRLDEASRIPDSLWNRRFSNYTPATLNYAT